MRVWQDETIKQDGHLSARLTYNDTFIDDPDNLGFKERGEHVSLIEAGSKAIWLRVRRLIQSARHGPFLLSTVEMFLLDLSLT